MCSSRTRWNTKGEHRWSCLMFFVHSLMLLSVRASWVDPDTPKDSRTTRPHTKGDTRQYELVFSDEFEKDGRTFHDGNDPRWTAINKNDYTNDALHFYSNQNARTSNGVLNITTEQKDNVYKAFDEVKKVFYADTKHIQSAMLQSWNKFCFIGGIVEFSAKLPGDPRKGGLWPALWLLGNLARATYVGSTEFIWPYSYTGCDPRTRISQEISACNKVNHYGMKPYRGRGSPEIDIIEAMQGDPGKLPNTHVQRPYQSASLQVAPGLDVDRPMLGHRPHEGHWYTPIEYGNTTKADLNPFFYGVTMIHKPKTYTYQADALSANMQLNDTHYKRMHQYRLEWEPPDDNGDGGYLKWYTDGQLLFGIFGESLTLMQTEIPSEPMYLLMNTAVSSSWGFATPCPENCECDCFECGNPSCACALPTNYCKNFPASFEIDYVRVYQAVNDSKHILGCSPENRPTEKWIEGHIKRYMSDGDKRPLQPIKTGGSPCESDMECGGAPYGTCSGNICICYEGYTGPNCLAHAGSYDFETNNKTSFSLSNIMIPRSLLVIMVLLALGFVACLAGTIRVKSKEAKYHKVPSMASSDMAFQAGPVNGPAAGYQNTSYQNTAASNYAMPPQQKVNTYCVIDSRLVDT